MSKVVPRAGACALHPRRHIPWARIMSEGVLAGGAERTRAPRNQTNPSAAACERTHLSGRIHERTRAAWRSERTRAAAEIRTAASDEVSFRRNCTNKPKRRGPPNEPERCGRPAAGGLSAEVIDPRKLLGFDATGASVRRSSRPGRGPEGWRFGGWRGSAN